MALIRSRSQPTPGFPKILQNALPEQVARAQAKFAFALALLGGLSVPENSLCVVQPAEFFIRENVSQHGLRCGVASSRCFLAPANSGINIAVFRLQIPLCQLDHGGERTLIGSFVEQ